MEAGASTGGSHPVLMSQATKKEDTMYVDVITTPTLLYLAREADRTERNRRLVTEELVTDLDPDGFHTLHRMLLHNDVEWRCRVTMKMTDQTEPVSAWLDIALDTYREVVEPESQRVQNAIGLKQTATGYTLGK